MVEVQSTTVSVLAACCPKTSLGESRAFGNNNSEQRIWIGKIRREYGNTGEGCDGN